VIVPRPPGYTAAWLRPRRWRQHRKVWLVWTRWWAVQVVLLPEWSFGIRVEWRRPLVDLFVGPITLAFGNHPVLSDPRTQHRHSGRGFVYWDERVL
jgi:hypothetical protein